MVYLAKGQSQVQNANESIYENLWEEATEPFTNGLDVVGYNYMEDCYEQDHKMFPERVILGSKNFPKEIGFRWPMVEKLPYVIGDFTWTAWDYIGEAGIGKAAYVDSDDPLVKKGPWALMPQGTSPYPWRLANDADFDITGRMLPQGAYRSIVWGSEKTFLYSMHPDTYGKTEVVGMWGFPYVLPNRNYKGYENKPIELVIFSNAEEVKILVNGNSIGKKKVSFNHPLPNSVRFETTYSPGKVEAISFKGGKEVSRDVLLTSKEPSKIRLVPEKTTMYADGHDLIYVGIDILDEDGKVVTDAEVSLTAKVSGAMVLAGFGTGNPITDENYTDNKTVSFSNFTFRL